MAQSNTRPIPTPSTQERIDALQPTAANFGAELDALRKEFDLTVDDLATLLGVTRQTVARWEQKPSSMPESKLRRLKIAFTELNEQGTAGNFHTGFLTIRQLLDAQGEALKVYLIKSGMPFLSGGPFPVRDEMVKLLQKVEYHFFFTSSLEDEANTIKEAAEATVSAAIHHSTRPARDSFAEFKRTLLPVTDHFKRVHGWRIPLQDESILLQRAFLFSPVILEFSDERREMYFEVPVITRSESGEQRFPYQWKWIQFPPPLFTELWRTQLEPSINAVMRDKKNEFLSTAKEMSAWPKNIEIRWPQGLDVTS